MCMAAPAPVCDGTPCQTGAPRRIPSSAFHVPFVPLRSASVMCSTLSMIDQTSVLDLKVASACEGVPTVAMKRSLAEKASAMSVCTDGAAMATVVGRSGFRTASGNGIPGTRPSPARLDVSTSASSAVRPFGGHQSATIVATACATSCVDARPPRSAVRGARRSARTAAIARSTDAAASFSPRCSSIIAPEAT
jgi:hypothetical protein